MCLDQVVLVCLSARWAAGNARDPDAMPLLSPTPCPPHRGRRYLPRYHRQRRGNWSKRRGHPRAWPASTRRSRTWCRSPVRRVNDLRVFAARSRRGSSVGRTRGVEWRSSTMEISTGALDAGAQDHRSGDAARGAGSGYRSPGRAICRHGRGPARSGDLTPTWVVPLKNSTSLQAAPAICCVPCCGRPLWDERRCQVNAKRLGNDYPSHHSVVTLAYSVQLELNNTGLGGRSTLQIAVGEHFGSVDQQPLVARSRLAVSDGTLVPVAIEAVPPPRGTVIIGAKRA
jgi:hypothetical protein